MNTYKLRHEIGNIPDNESGVYWFKLRFPTPYSFGFDNKTPEETADTLVETIHRFAETLNNLQLSSRATNRKGIMLLNSFKVTLTPDPVRSQTTKLLALFKNKPLSNLESTIRMIQFAVNELPPVYVGITEKQSFKQRFDQHFRGESNILEELNQLGLSWDWLNFIIFPQFTYDLESLREIEQIFHYMLKPILSRG